MPVFNRWPIAERDQPITNKCMPYNRTNKDKHSLPWHFNSLKVGGIHDGFKLRCRDICMAKTRFVYNENTFEQDCLKEHTTTRSLVKSVTTTSITIGQVQCDLISQITELESRCCMVLLALMPGALVQMSRRRNSNKALATITCRWWYS